jgi:hypothetical protein
MGVKVDLDSFFQFRSQYEGSDERIMH